MSGGSLFAVLTMVGNRIRRVAYSVELCRRYPVTTYCLVAFAITWGLRALYAWYRSRYGMPAFNFALIASFGPSIAGILLIAFTEGRAGLRRTGRSLVEWRVGAGWLFMAAFFEFGLFGGIAALYRFRYGGFPAEAEGGVLGSLGALLLTFVVGLFRWGVAEEIGWRGWMLPKLQGRMSPFAATMVLAVVITLWHLHPHSLSEIASGKEGTYLPGYYSDAAERLVISIPIALVLTFLYNRTGGSLLVQVVYHSASNTSYFWVEGAFGVVGTDFFKVSFLVALAGLAIVFSTLVWRQEEGVTIGPDGHDAMRPQDSVRSRFPGR